MTRSYPDLEGLDDAGWHTQSLCAEWDVQQVVGHMVGTATTKKLNFVMGVVRQRGNLDAFLAHIVARNSAGTPAQTLAAFKQTMHNRNAPPGPDVMWLGEAIIHSEDIRRPLGMSYDYSVPAVGQVADFYARTNLLFGAKKRISGLSLVATDVEWHHGKGDVVSGPILSLLMTMTGRDAHLNDLEGSGLEQYRDRVAH